MDHHGNEGAVGVIVRAAICIGWIQCYVDEVTDRDIAQGYCAIDAHRVSSSHGRTIALRAILKDADGRSSAPGVVLIGVFLQGSPVQGDCSPDLADPTPDDPVFRAAIGSVRGHPILPDLVERGIATPPAPFLLVPEVICGLRPTGS